MSFANEANIQPLLWSPTEAVIAAVKQENEQLRFVTGELGHRMKNLVAVIQSIARQTMHQTTTKADFEARFSGRLGRSVVPSIFSSPTIGTERVSTNSCVRS